jgi:hypothetical protein
MRLVIVNKLPPAYDRGSWATILREIETQVNLASEWKIEGAYNALTAAPTTGAHQQGDFIRNSAPAVISPGGTCSDYVVFGWLCIDSGTPGTWWECKFFEDAATCEEETPT